MTFKSQCPALIGSRSQQSWFEMKCFASFHRDPSAAQTQRRVLQSIGGFFSMSGSFSARSSVPIQYLEGPDGLTITNTCNTSDPQANMVRWSSIVGSSATSVASVLLRRGRNVAVAHAFIVVVPGSS